MFLNGCQGVDKGLRIVLECAESLETKRKQIEVFGNRLFTYTVVLLLVTCK